MARQKSKFYSPGQFWRGNIRILDQRILATPRLYPLNAVTANYRPWLRTHPKLFHLRLEDLLVVAEGTLEEVAGCLGRPLSAALVKPG